MLTKFLLIDGNSIFHRSYHAIPPLKTSDGEPINAVYGFFSMLLYAIEKEKPQLIAIAFDKGKKTFRAQMFADYKAHRPECPDDLYIQMPRVREILDLLKIPYFEHDDYEADDIIGTLSAKAEKSGDILSIILSSDMDNLQLVTERIVVAAPKGFKDYTYYSPKEVVAKYGLTPEEFLEYKSLKGDSSDNIPGVKGIGEKTAIALLQKYKNVKNIYEHLDEVKSGVKQKLLDGKDSAEMSKKLATIIKDGPFEFDRDNFLFGPGIEKGNIVNLFRKLEFKSLEKRLNKLLVDFVVEKENQPSLF